MKKLLLTLAFCFFATGAWAQCNGVFPANTICGNNTGSPAIPTTIPAPTSGGGGIIVTVRSANTSPVTVAPLTDYFLCIDPTTVPITVNLPASPTTGMTFLVKDCTGQAATHNITITPAAGNIDGAATSIMTTNFQSEAVTYNGVQWSVN